MTLLSRAAKVQILADGKKIAYLIYLHLVADDNQHNLFEQLLESEF
jgi:hypothetical protein